MAVESFSYDENIKYAESILEQKAQSVYLRGLRQLETFFREQFNYKTASKVNKTNVINQQTGQTWALPDDVFGQMMQLIEECRKEGSILHISERQQYENLLSSGIMLDFDCKYRIANPEIKKTSKSKLVEAIMEIVVDTIDFPNLRPDETTKVGIIERPRSSLIEIEKLYKKGFHILIPGILLTRPHKKYIIAEIRKSARIEQILAEMGVANGLAACDENSASVPVFFIGSCKVSGGLKYELTNVYDVTLTPGYIRTQEINDITSLSKYNLAYEFCLTHEAKYTGGLAAMISKREYKCSGRISTKVDDLYARSINGTIPNSDLVIMDNKVNILVQSSPDALYMQGLLSILTPEYYTERNKWRDVIFALANSSTGRVNYYELACWFSQKCPEKWQQGGEAALNEIWEESRIRQTTGAVSGHKFLTERSIAYWARLCDPARYAETSKDNYLQKLIKYTYEYQGQIENSMVADIIHSMLKFKFYADYEGKTVIWYEFITNEDHNIQYGEVWKWRREPCNPISIQQYMTDKLPVVFKDVIKRQEDNRNSKADNKELGKYMVSVVKNLKKSQLRLFNNTFKEKTIKECINWFVNRGFAKKLDVTCPNIIGVGNGLLELGRVTRFIDHYHEHPVSKFTTVPWAGKFDPNNPNPFQQKLLDMVADIIIENDARIKLMIFLSTGLVGGVKNLPLLLIVGGGSNGKTVLMTLTMETLGKDVYASFINPMVYSKQPESADRANSSLMQFKGKNFTVGEETNKGDPMCPAAIKGAVKSSGVSTRELHSKQESFQITATQIVTTQYEFIVPTTDHGTWRRLQLYRARTRFCANPDKNNEFEAKDDPKCREMPNDRNYQIAWLQILVYFYEWFQDQYDGNYDLVPSSTIDLQTENFRNEQDKINQFIYKFIVISPKYSAEGVDANLESVALKYIKWYDVHFGGSKRQTLSDIVKEFENSAIQNHLRRNRQGVYETFGIRVMEEKEFLRDGESYFKARNDDYRPQKDKTPFWWKRNNNVEIKENKIIKTNDSVDKKIIARECGDDKEFENKKEVKTNNADDSFDILSIFYQNGKDSF